MKSKLSRIAVILFVATIAITTYMPAFAAEAAKEKPVQKPIDMVLAKRYIKSMIDLCAKRTENYRLDVNAMADYAIQTLRGPNSDGSGYRFAQVKSVKNDLPEIITETKITSILELEKKQTVRGESRITNALQIHLPKYRSGGLFKNNGDAYIHSYTVEYSIEGKKYTITKEYKNWLPRNNSIDIPLPGIAEWAKIETDISVKTSDLEKTTVQLGASHPAIDDDPANPFSYSLDQLRSIKKNITYANPEDLTKMLKEAARGIDAVPASIGVEPAAE